MKKHNKVLWEVLKVVQVRHKVTEKLIRSCSCHKVFPLFLVHKDQQLEFKPQHLTLDPLR